MIPGWNFPPTVVGNESLRGIFSLRLSATKSLAGFPACNRREQNPGREFIACGCRLVFPCGDGRRLFFSLKGRYAGMNRQRREGYININ